MDTKNDHGHNMVSKTYLIDFFKILVILHYVNKKE